MATSQQERCPPPRPPPPQTLSAQPSFDASASSSVSVSNVSTFKDFQKLHYIVHKHVQKGLVQDERGENDMALQNYSKGLTLLERAMRVNCDQLARSSSEEKEQVKQMQQKMTKTKQQITSRLQEMQRDQNEARNQQIQCEPSAPPSYEDVISNSSSQNSFMDEEIMACGESIMNDTPDSHPELTDATAVFSIEDGVQVFYITPEGYVSAPSYPSPLHVVKLPENQGASEQRASPAFLHVGDFVYPLASGTSPALHTTYGAYLFPDMMSDQPGAAVGVMLPDTVSTQQQQRFEEVIRSMTIYQEQIEDAVVTPPTPQEQVREPERGAPAQPESHDLSTKISKGITVAADWISWGVNKGAEKAGVLIKAGSEKIIEKTKPSDKPHKVDSRVQQGVVYARQATHVTVKVTGYLVNKLGEVTAHLAKQVAPHLRKTGQQFIPKSLTKEDGSGKSKLDGVVEVAASGLKGLGVVWIGLESAGKCLAKNMANGTVQVVHHKYGAEAGSVTENAVYAAGNAAMTAYNANSFGVKAIAKRAAKDTGKAVLTDLHQSQIGSKQGASSNGRLPHPDKAPPKT